MKKYLSLLFCSALALGLCACSSDNTDNVKTHEVDSKIYSQEEISSAIEVIQNEFKNEWDGCTLTEIYYAGDDSLDSYRDLVAQNKTDEVMVLASSFDVDETGSDGSLEPNSTYCWMWILIKDDNGNWQHVDHGY